MACVLLSGCGAATKGSHVSTDSSAQVQTSGEAVNLNIKAMVTQEDNGRTVKLHVGDGIAVGFTGPCGISVDPPGMLEFYQIPTPSNRLFLHAVTRGRGALVARGSCNAQSLDGATSTQPSSTYTVTIVVS
jgi:hypothetical protein